MIYNPWYLEYKKNSQAAIRLFCFHHSGGGASAYYPWVEHLSPHIEMIPIQLPGRENRFMEPLTNNLKDIVNSLTKGFYLYKDKPFFVFGHSLGGLIAFELIKSIYQRYSLYPRHMIISATKAPHMPFRMQTLSSLGNKALKEELKVYNGIDERILHNDELLDLFLPIIRNDFSISERYRSADVTPFPCDILHLSGNQDVSVNEEEIQAWRAHTTGKFEHISFPGGHFFIKDHQKNIIKLINQIAEQYIQVSM
jgi:medium-chain acyl-[acyl-carrier-protein] hydrolase